MTALERSEAAATENYYLRMVRSQTNGESLYLNGQKPQTQIMTALETQEATATEKYCLKRSEAKPTENYYLRMVRSQNHRESLY